MGSPEPGPAGSPQSPALPCYILSPRPVVGTEQDRAGAEPGAHWALCDSSFPLLPSAAGVTFHSLGSLPGLSPILLTGVSPKSSTPLSSNCEKPLCPHHSASDLRNCSFPGACSLAHPWGASGSVAPSPLLFWPGEIDPCCQ